MLQPCDRVAKANIDWGGGVGVAIVEKGISSIKRNKDLCLKMSDAKKKSLNTFALDCGCKQNKI